MAGLPGLRLRGLMTIPPLPQAPEDSRPHYKEMRKLLEDARGWGHGAEFIELSMGMSGDFEVGVEEGATIVRVGTAIFGPAGLSRERPARSASRSVGRTDRVDPGQAGRVRGWRATWARPSSAASPRRGSMPVGHLMMADVRADRLEELKRLYGIVRRPGQRDARPAVRRDHPGRQAADPRRRAGRDRSRHAREAPDLGRGRRVHERDPAAPPPGHPDDPGHAEHAGARARGRHRASPTPRGSTTATWTPPARSSRPSGAWWSSTRR